MEILLTRRNTIILVVMVALWRLHLSAALQLHPDEAYYWLWSRYLDVGYFDHPPMVAYFIWISTFFSKSELWVRLSGTVVLLILSGLMWRLAMQLYKSESVAAGSVLLFNLYPLTMLGMIVITPDVPVFLFWSVSVYLFWQAIRSQKTWLWYALGVTFGLALLSKYTAVLMVPCFFIYLLLTDDRRWLKTIYPYLAMLIGFVCFLPVVFWNSNHDWVSFIFQLRHGLQANEGDAGKVAEYTAGQMLIAGPVVWLLGMYAAGVGLYRRDKETLLLVCTAVPIILFFGFTSFRKLAGPNWPVFAYFSFSILVSKYCLDGYSKIRRSLWSVALGTTLALSLTATLHARFSLIPLNSYSAELASADATNWFYGWRELGAELKKHPDQNLVITPSHQLSAEIIYYTDARVTAQTAKGSRPSQFNLWDRPSSPPGKDPLYVWTDADYPDLEPSYFAASSTNERFTAFREGRVVRTYHIISDQNALIPPALEQ